MREPWAGASAGTWSEADTWKVINNPGFAPETTEYTEYSHTGKFYTKETSGFRENYTDVMCDSKNKLTYRERDGFTNDMVQKMVNPFNHDERY